jgi:hypothetical protein
MPKRRVEVKREVRALAISLSIGVLAVIPNVISSFPLQESLIIDGDPVITVLPKDAIPAIDRPEFIPVTEADLTLEDEEPVLGVRRGAVARAYSLWQLNHHEIVNDQVGDLPLAITW